MRLADSLGWSEQEFLSALGESFLLSADNAHAAHPNRTACADPVTRPRLNGGVVLKFSGAQRYATDAVSAAVVRRAGECTGIPIQTFVNHSDYPGGTTLGNLSVRQVAVRTADVGIAQLAMHAPYETCGTKDIAHLAALCRTIYSGALHETAPGAYDFCI
jgi:aspartyl aminopeptidase